jgi:hypothetical protein
MAGVIASITEPLGVSSPEAAAYTASGVVYDHAVAGLPFMQATTDRDPYQRGLAEQRRQQIDTSTEPGEQSLEGWWLRSQTDFTGGAGVTYLEPVNDEFVMRSFTSSVGLDVWTPGVVSLLPDVAESKALGSGATGMAVVTSNGTDYVFCKDGANVYRDGTAVTGWTNTPTSLVSAGDRLLATHSGGIDLLVAPFTTPTSLVTGAGSAPSAWWVKQRIIASIGASLYEIPLSGGALPAALYTHPNAGWVWTSVVESPTAILAAGYAGNQSAVFKFTLDSSGALPTLTKAVTAAELPVGETVHGLFFYLGLCAIGTSKGVRVATVRDDGSLVYGPLSYSSSAVVSAFAGRDRFVYFGIGDAPQLHNSGLPVSSGLVRIDLSSTDGAGRYAWANDLRTTSAGSVSAVQVLSDGRVGFTDSDGSTGHLWLSSATNLTSLGGELTTGLARFNTLEPKMFRNARLRGSITGGTATLFTYDGTNRNSLFTYSQNTDFGELLNLPTETPRASLGLTIQFTRDGSDTTVGPVLSGWQIRALPAVERAQILIVPLSCFDIERDQFGNTAGGEGTAMMRLTALLDAVKDGQLVTYQNLNTGERLTVQVEDVQFRQSGPSIRTEGFGGLLTVRLRSV